MVSSPEEAKDKAESMLGNVLVTKQTGEEGKEVSTVYFNEATDIGEKVFKPILIAKKAEPHIADNTINKKKLLKDFFGNKN